MQRRKFIIVLITIVVMLSTYVMPTYATIEKGSASNMLKNEVIIKDTQTKDDRDAALRGEAETGTDVKYKGNVVIAKKDGAKPLAVGSNQDGFIAKIFGVIIDFLTYIFSSVLQGFVNIIFGQPEDKINDEDLQIEKMVFNEYSLFNINFFQKSDQIDNSSSYMNAVKDKIRDWYYGLRTLSIIASFCVLLYIAIRMAISTVASEKTKYKKMLENWFVSLIIVFVLHYLIIVMIYMSDSIVDIIRSVVPQTNFEKNMVDNIKSFQYTGWAAFGMSVIRFALIYYQVKFVMLYFKRMVVVGFLITISPLITITYSIDKAGDNKAQAFNQWKDELITAIFVQPVHALLFLIFVYSAGEVVKYSAFLAILFLFSISKGEKVLRNVLRLQNSESIKGIKDTKFGNPWQAIRKLRKKDEEE